MVDNYIEWRIITEMCEFYLKNGILYAWRFIPLLEIKFRQGV